MKDISWHASRRTARALDEIEYTVALTRAGRTLAKAQAYMRRTLEQVDLNIFPEHIAELNDWACDADNLQDFRARAKYFAKLAKAHLTFLEEKRKDSTNC